ncbi:hypothetical protein CALVIDRAFT_539201, partial [Calocera viscosa TUFC12733]
MRTGIWALIALEQEFEMIPTPSVIAVTIGCNRCVAMELGALQSSAEAQSSSSNCSIEHL